MLSTAEIGNALGVSDVRKLYKQMNSVVRRIELDRLLGKSVEDQERDAMGLAQRVIDGVNTIIPEEQIYSILRDNSDAIKAYYGGSPKLSPVRVRTVYRWKEIAEGIISAYTPLSPEESSRIARERMERSFWASTSLP